MVNFINIKRKIGELVDQHLGDEDVSEAIDFDNDGQPAYISFHKSKSFSYISIDVTTNDIVYKFKYPNRQGEKFNMSELENLSSYSTKYDD